VAENSDRESANKTHLKLELLVNYKSNMFRFKTDLRVEINSF